MVCKTYPRVKTSERIVTGSIPCFDSAHLDLSTSVGQLPSLCICLVGQLRLSVNIDLSLKSDSEEYSEANFQGAGVTHF